VDDFKPLAGGGGGGGGGDGHESDGEGHARVREGLPPPPPPPAQKKGGLEMRSQEVADIERQVGHHRYCSPRHPMYFEPWFIDYLMSSLTQRAISDRFLTQRVISD
jgi:hypothetical protein